MSTATLPSPSVRAITRTYRAALPEHVSKGLAWYREAHALAVSLDPDNVPRAAGVIAALSPQLSWDRNVDLARRAYAEGRASAPLGASNRKADRILAGEAPLDVLGGPKVRAFYACIVDPDCDAVCVDRHAVDVAIGRRTDDSTRNAILGRKGGYDATADAYRRAAKILGVPAPAVQAVTWTAWRAQWAWARDGKPLQAWQARTAV